MAWASVLVLGWVPAKLLCTHGIFSLVSTPFKEDSNISLRGPLPVTISNDFPSTMSLYMKGRWPNGLFAIHRRQNLSSPPKFIPGVGLEGAETRLLGSFLRVPVPSSWALYKL